MLYLNESDGYVNVSCEKCDKINKISKSLCKQFGDEFHLNPPITCSCGNIESVAYKKVMVSPSYYQVHDNDELNQKRNLGFKLENDNKVNWVFWSPQLPNIDIKTLINICTPTPVLNGIEGIEEGVKKTVRKTSIYKMGKYEGQKEGFTQASEKYEDKLKRQAIYFEDQKVLLERDIEEYRDLIKEYEKYIEEKEAEFEYLSKEQLKELVEIGIKYKSLLKMKY